MRKLAKWFGWILLADLLVFVAYVALTLRPADPTLWPPGANVLKTEIHVVSHGYHSSIVIQRAAARERASLQSNHAVFALARYFERYEWLEIGWGDEGFYRLVPTIASVTASEATRALLKSGNPS